MTDYISTRLVLLKIVDDASQTLVSYQGSPQAVDVDSRTESAIKWPYTVEDWHKLLIKATTNSEVLEQDLQQDYRMRAALRIMEHQLHPCLTDVEKDAKVNEAIGRYFMDCQHGGIGTLKHHEDQGASDKGKGRSLKHSDGHEKEADPHSAMPVYFKAR